MLDARAVNPRGRTADYTGARRSLSRLEMSEHRWWITQPDGLPVTDGRLDVPTLEERQLTALRPLDTVSCDPPGQRPLIEATLILQLAAAGPVLHVPHLPDALRDLLHPELREILKAAPPHALADPLAWESRSVRQRRAALRHHATCFALTPLLPGADRLPHLPTVSVLLATMRTDHLPAALEMLDAQSYPELEVVLGLHGCELTPALRERLSRYRYPVEVTEIPTGMNLGEVLGQVTRRARGSLVTKVDDDDMYGPEHIWDLVLAYAYSGATVVGKGAEFVRLDELDVTVRRSTMTSEDYSTVVAGGTMLAARGELEALGGWRPVPRRVDRALLDRVLQQGGSIYRTHPLGFVYRRHGAGHTWDPDLEYFLRNSGPQWRGLPAHAQLSPSELP